MELACELQDFANDKNTGFVKAWKAHSMAAQYIIMEALFEDMDRTLEWVKNCLEMEGFSHADCVSISNHIFEIREKINERTIHGA